MNISDHNAIFLNRKAIKMRTNHKRVMGRTYKNYEKEELVKSLKEANWQRYSQHKTPVKHVIYSKKNSLKFVTYMPQSEN